MASNLISPFARRRLSEEHEIDRTVPYPTVERIISANFTGSLSPHYRSIGGVESFGLERVTRVSNSKEML